MLKNLKHALIRRKAKIQDLAPSKFTVRLAQTAEEYEAAFNLVQVSYAYLGIAELGHDLYRITDQHLLPHSHVLLCLEGERIVGTVTVTLDSPGGIPLDKDYPEVVGQFRRRGSRLAEMGSFAVVQRRRRAGVAQLLALASARLVWRNAATHLIISIDPKVSELYEALYGFEPCTEAQSHVELDMSIMAMVATREGQRRHLLRHGGVHKPSGRSLEDLLVGEEPIPNCDVTTHGERPGLRPRLPRDTYQRLFLERARSMSAARPRALSYVRSLRSDDTLGTFLTAAITI